MKIKSLLLGSAAALVAATGARAADAVIIPEPHLVEYVRVCDTYGTGFFYIPGTETCLSISGYVRYEMNFASEPTDVQDISGTTGYENWGKRSEVRLNIDARNETELGTLRSYIRLGYDSNPKADGDNDASGLSIDKAFIELAGLKIGKDTTWWDWQVGADGDGLFDGGPGELGMISYTVNAGGFAWTLALEEDESGDYEPDVVLDIDGAIGDFGVRAGVAYNESEEAISGKIRLGYDFGVASLQVGYQYSDDDALGADYMSNFEHVFGADVSGDITDRLSARGGLNYGLDWFNTDIDVLKFGVGINYELVEGFDIDARVNHQVYMDDGALDLDDLTTARIRFTRSF